MRDVAPDPFLLTLLTTSLRRQMIGEGRSVEASGETYEGEFSGHHKLLAPAWGASYGQVNIGSKSGTWHVPPFS